MIDIHPISVHFPIALLTVYTIVQLIPSRITQKTPQLFFLNIFLLFTGSAGLLVARQLGDLLEHTPKYVGKLVEAHSLWATISTAFYGILTILYVLLLLKKIENNSRMPHVVRMIATRAQVVTSFVQFLFDYYVITFLALLGFVFITITGALGGAIVYGPEADPMVSFVYRLLVR